MIFLAEFTLLDVRKNPILAQYMPHWNINCPLNHDAMYSGQVLLAQSKLEINDSCIGLLTPLVHSYWNHVREDDELTGFEGSRPSIKAKILKIYGKMELDE